MKKRIKLAVVSLCAALLFPMSAQAKELDSLADAEKLAKEKVKDATVVEMDSDYDNGGLMYEIILAKDSKEYKLTYRQSDGKLVEYECERTDTDTTKGRTLSKKKIRSKANKKVPSATIVSITLDREDKEYKVEMEKGSKTYTLVYHSISGRLLEYGWKAVTYSDLTSKYIGIEEVKTIALKKVPEGTFVKVEFDEDDGVPVYEVEMKKNKVEYELKIHAETGEILDYEIE